MPMIRSLYPLEWEQIALAVKTAADWTCQECGRPCRKPGESIAQLFQRLPCWIREGNASLLSTMARKPQRWTLTTAHLNHDPGDCRWENMKAMCAPCHCRYDAPRKAADRRAKKVHPSQLRIEA